MLALNGAVDRVERLSGAAIAASATAALAMDWLIERSALRRDSTYQRSV